jgi:hypothetical protein
MPKIQSCRVLNGSRPLPRLLAGALIHGSLSLFAKVGLRSIEAQTPTSPGFLAALLVPLPFLLRRLHASAFRGQYLWTQLATMELGAPVFGNDSFFRSLRHLPPSGPPVGILFSVPGAPLSLWCGNELAAGLRLSLVALALFGFLGPEVARSHEDGPSSFGNLSFGLTSNEPICASLLHKGIPSLSIFLLAVERWLANVKIGLALLLCDQVLQKLWPIERIVMRGLSSFAITSPGRLASSRRFGTLPGPGIGVAVADVFFVQTISISWLGVPHPGAPG